MLRDYQQKVVDDCMALLPLHKTGLIVLPTGTGKTVTGVHVAQAVSKKRVLWLVHMDLLASQAAKAFEEWLGWEVGYEMNVLQVNQFNLPRVVVSTVQTMSNRMHRFSPDDFDLIVCDEGHHSVSATWTTCIDYFMQNPECVTIGMTATPDRGDRRALGKVFNVVICNYDVRWGVDNGWLVPVKEKHVHIEDLDISSVRTTAGDLNKKQMNQIIESHSVMYETACKLPELCANSSAIIYCRSVVQANMLCTVMKHAFNMTAEVITGKITGRDRTDILKRSRSGETQFLINVGVLIEGVDAPWVDTIVLTCPTKVRARFTQMVGRGLRPQPGVIDGITEPALRRKAIAESNKPYATILSFVGEAGRHKLVYAGDVLGGDMSDPIRRQYKKAAAEAEEPMSPEELRQLAEEMSAAEERRRIREANEQAAIELTTAVATCTVKEYDPFDVWEIKKDSNEDRKPLPKLMSNLLKKQGVPQEVYSTLSQGQAGMLIGNLMQRHRKGLCTYKQMQLLGKYGVNGNKVRKKDASDLIDQIKAAGWKRPDNW